MRTINKTSWLIFMSLTFILILSGCTRDGNEPGNKSNEFSFVFMTDIHVQPEKDAIQGYKQAIDTIERLNPDFVITGGDLVMDVLGTGYERADSLYNLYQNITAELTMPVYNTMGNHEVFGWYEKSGVDPSHAEYGKKMFEKRLGERYYSFDHKGWHFLILDSVEENEEGGYKGYISEEQIEWIKEDLSAIDKNTPVCVSVHIPVFTMGTQYLYGALEANRKGTVINNTREFLDLFTGYNLKLVLQGHIHILEDIFINNVHFVTGGAVSGAWWSGDNYGTEEGFLFLKIKGDDFNWEYIDFGWKVEEEIDH